MRGTQASQPLPILVGQPSLGLRPSRTGVPLISHVVFALGLSSALNTSLQWLEHGDVLRSYSFFKVHLPRGNERQKVADCETASNPLVMNGEKGGVNETPKTKFF